MWKVFNPRNSQTKSSTLFLHHKGTLLTAQNKAFLRGSQPFRRSQSSIFLWHQIAYCRVHKSPILDIILSQCNPVSIFMLQSIKKYLNIALPSLSRALNGPLPLISSDQNLLCILPCACTSRPIRSHQYWVQTINNDGPRYADLSVLCYLTSLRSRHARSLQHTILYFQV
jgi:hypothetical protein